MTTMTKGKTDLARRKLAEIRDAAAAAGDVSTVVLADKALAELDEGGSLQSAILRVRESYLASNRADEARRKSILEKRKNPVDP